MTNRITSSYRMWRQDWDERQLARRILERGKWYEPLHGDPVLQDIVDRLIQDCRISLFVETGTFVGDTSKYIALKHPDVLVLSCELNPRWLRMAKRFCEGIANIRFFQGQSANFLANVFETLESNNVLFWLDAHWGEYWPLVDDTKVISSLTSFAAIVDDFEVPGNQSFHYDSYGGVKNGLSLHAPVLGRECLVPNYDPSPSCQNPAGYGLFLRGRQCSNFATPSTLKRLAE
jgi:hypothetical protein